MPDFTRMLAELIGEREKLSTAILAIERLQKDLPLLPRARGRPRGSPNKPKAPIATAMTSTMTAK
jgi:hypothetical protein